MCYLPVVWSGREGRREGMAWTCGRSAVFYERRRVGCVRVVAALAGCGVLCARDAMRARRWRESCVCLSPCDGCVLVDVGRGRAFVVGTSVRSRRRRAPHPTHRQQLPQLLPELLLVGRRGSHGGQHARFGGRGLLGTARGDAYTYEIGTRRGCEVMVHRFQMVSQRLILLTSHTQFVVIRCGAANMRLP